jgi:hypothetical protein
MAEEQSRKIDQIGGHSLVFDADIKDESKEIKLAKNGNYTNIYSLSHCLLAHRLSAT